ncbi:hypothetical protein CCACVL1_04894 [Corchorus capsularis]|uniref:Uncharacterized protein n=1 Tax=Corchorus capsularis TaxID=210143 RepID=A0A1R3JP29_COCAP|nr:hypothetical protein CCACVL1_04894 [Corchorus capsularis]
MAALDQGQKPLMWQKELQDHQPEMPPQQYKTIYKATRKGKGFYLN